MSFNTSVSPKAKTELFKIYADVSSTSTPSWELQGRGVASWSVESNQEITKENDVLGMVDISRGPTQPALTGVSLKLRSGSTLAEILFDAWYTGDTSKIDNIQFLQKFEFVDAATTGYCKARLEKDCAIGINSFGGEAGGYLSFEVDIHFANNFETGKMLIEDASPVAFVSDTASSSNSEE